MREAIGRRSMPMVLLLAIVMSGCAGHGSYSGSSVPDATPVLGWSVLSPILSFRRGWIDSTRVDACAIYHGMGNPADFPAGLPSALRPLLGTWGATPCEPAAGRSASPLERYSVERVRFDSITGDEHIRHVHFTVQKGEYIHHEDYTMRASSRPGEWTFGELRIWGATQVFLR